MPRSISLHYAVLALTALFGVAASAVDAQQLLANGDFETSSLSGWTVTTHGNGSFFALAPGADTPAVAPDTTTFFTAANPIGGSAFAVSASGNPGVQALLQDFVAPVNPLSVTLSFQMFVNDQSFVGSLVDPSGLDETTGGLAVPNDNQHARVDLLRAGASDLSTDPNDVLANFYLGVDNPGGITPNPYLSYTFDLTPYVQTGGAYRIRFADVNNLGSINLGVDNVSVFAAVPEPGALPLFVSSLTMLLGAGFMRRAEFRVFDLNHPHG